LSRAVLLGFFFPRFISKIHSAIRYL
jgi:hypothetical protein